MPQLRDAFDETTASLTTTAVTAVSTGRSTRDAYWILQNVVNDAGQVRVEVS